MLSNVAANNRQSPQPGRTAILLPSSLTESYEIVVARLLDLATAQERPIAAMCVGTVAGCPANPFGVRMVCKHCVRVSKQALAEVAPDAEVLTLHTSHRDPDSELTPFANAEILRGATSTILTFYRRTAETPSTHPLSRIAFSKVQEGLRAHSTHIYLSLKQLIRERQIKRIEFFNGRIAPTLAAHAVAKESGADFAVIEVSGLNRNLSVLYNSLVHDFVSYQNRLNAWIAAHGKKPDLGEEFFRRKRAGIPTEVRSFSADAESLANIPPGRPILAVYTSSDDEMQVAGTGWTNQFSRSPGEFLRKLAFSPALGHTIVVRMHPNQRGDKTGAARNLERTLNQLPNTFVISPKSKQSSYELLDQADAVLSFGSTVGLEATYWGKPSFLAGKAFWEDLPIAYSVDSVEDLVARLNGRPLPMSREASLQVGAFLMEGFGSESSLAWDPLSGRYYANGTNFLAQKRSGFPYWISRLIDRLLR